MIDLHVHTALCGHAEGLPGEYARVAAERGITVLGITDHMPLAPALAAAVPGAGSYAMDEGDLERYVTEVRMAAETSSSLGVEVLLGIEADLVASAVEHARTVAARYPFDLVLGSVHFIDDWAFDDPARRERYEDWDTRTLWERYFEEFRAAASCGVADVMAHPDLVKKFCGAPDFPVEDLYAAAAETLAASGIAVEVSTAGLRKPCQELYPDEVFLRFLRDAKVPVTLGSDAHVPTDVGRDLDRAVEALRAVGYRSVLVFRNRTPEEVALP